MGLPEAIPKFARPRALRPRRLPCLVLLSTLFIFGLFYILLSIAPCMVPGSSCYRGYHSRFSFDAGDAQHPRWMQRVRDDANLTTLSIPGTHDTMTYGMVDNERLQCQNWNLSAQLDAGLRYFDIRARLEDDELRIYHANGFTGFSYPDVLLDMFSFLDANPSEAVIMRLKEEGRPLGDKNTKTFEEAFNYYRRDSPQTADGAERHLYLYDRVAPLPTLGDLRGKVFLLQEFKTAGGTPYGLAWDGDQMVLEDYWIIPDVYHLADKWTAIRSALEDAAQASPDNGALYLSHTSASVGVLPIEAAAGPLNRTMAGMNDMTGQWLRDFGGVDGAARTGVVIFDFPGKSLIDAVLRWNEPLMA